MNERQTGDLSNMDPVLHQQLAALGAERRRAADEFTAGGGSCWICADTGWVGFTLCAVPGCAAAARERALVAEKEAAAFTAMLAQSGMPPEMARRELGRDFARWGPVAASLQRYAATWTPQARGLWMYGDLGTAKSSLMAAVVRQLAQKNGGRIAWYLTAAYLGELRAAMGSGHYAQILERGRGAAYCVLDDMGRANLGEWVSETLFMVVAGRVDAQLPIFVTSNYGPEQLAQRLGEHGAAIIDRLRQACFTVRLTGVSLRQSQDLDLT